MYSIIKRKLLFFITLGFFLLTIYTLNLGISKSPKIVFGVILTLPIYMLGPFLFLKKLRENKRLLLIDFFKVAIFFTIVLQFMFHVINLDFFEKKIYTDSFIVNLENSPFVLSLVLITFICLHIPYLFFYKIKNKEAKLSYTVVNFWLPLNLLLISSIISLFFLVSQFSGYGSSIYYTENIYSLVKSVQNIINPVCFGLLSYIFLNPLQQNSNYFKRMFYFIFIIQILTGLTSGMKEFVIIPVIIYLYFYLYFNHKIQKKYILILITFGLLLYPITNNYRTLINNNFDDKISNNDLLLFAISNTFKSNDIISNIQDGLENYSSRTDLYTYLNEAIKKENQWTYYKNMNRYFTIPFFPFVPRVFWKDKYRYDGGNMFYDEILVNRETNNSVSVSCIGWAYLEGGIHYLILIFLIIGFIFQFLDKMTNFSLKMKLLWITSFVIVIKPEWDPFFTIINIIQSYIFLSIFFYYIKQKNNVSFIQKT